MQHCSRGSDRARQIGGGNFIYGAYLVLALPGTWLCTGLAGVSAFAFASAMVASSLARLAAWRAQGPPMTPLVAGMPTQQIPATLLAALGMDVAAARQYWCHSARVCMTKGAE